MLRQRLLFWFGCLSIQFFNLDTLVSDLRNAMPRQRSLTRTHVTYGTLCHARGHFTHTHSP